MLTHNDPLYLRIDNHTCKKHGNVKPPDSNTEGILTSGSDSTPEDRLGIGWLTLTMGVENMDVTQALMARLWQSEVISCDRGMHNYEFSAEGRCGIKFAWTPFYTEEENKLLDRKPTSNDGKLTWYIPQTALDELTHIKLQHLLLSVEELQCTSTRIDIYYDDFKYRQSPTQLYDKLLVGQLVIPHYRAITKYGKHDLRKLDKPESRNYAMDGDTLVVGSRKSNKFMRIYDKNLESGGKINAIRYEVQYTGKMATQALTHILQALMLDVANGVNVITKKLGQLFVGAITFLHNSFPDKALPKNLKRDLRRADFWTDIVGSIDGIRITLPTKAPCINRTLTWFNVQVLPSLAVLMNCAEFHNVDKDKLMHTYQLLGNLRFDTKHHILMLQGCGEDVPDFYMRNR